MAENLYIQPITYGKMFESPSYQVLGTGLTDRVFLIGHSDNLILNDPYQVLNIRDAVQKLGADSNVPLLRALIECYYTGCRDIWLIATAPMSEFQADYSLRDYNYYSTLQSRLQVTYDLLLQWDLPQILIPIDAAFYDTKGVDMLTPLAKHCSDAFDNTGAIRLGFLGTKIGTGFSEDDVLHMTTDSRLNSLGQMGKFVIVVVGEGVLTFKELPVSYSSSLSNIAAAQVATMPLNRSLTYCRLQYVINVTGILTNDQRNRISNAKLNAVVRNRLGERGTSFQTVVLTDNTLGPSHLEQATPVPDTDFWCLAQIRTVMKVIDRVRAIGRRALGTIALGSFKQELQNFFIDLKNNDFVKDYSYTIVRDQFDKNQVNVDVSITPYFGLRQIAFTVTVGPGINNAATL